MGITLQRMVEAAQTFVVAGSTIEFARNTMHALALNDALGSDRIYSPIEVIESTIRHWLAHRWLVVWNERELAKAMLTCWEGART